MKKVPINTDVVRSATRWLTGARPELGCERPGSMFAWPPSAGYAAGQPNRLPASVNHRAAAGISAFCLIIAGLTVPIYTATHKDKVSKETVVEEVFAAPETLDGAAALAVAPSLVGVSDPVDASLVALGKANELRSYDNTVIAVPREDYTKLLRRAKVIEELLRRLEANSLEPSGAKITDGVEQMVDYAINAQIKALDLPRGATPDPATVLQNALTVQTLRLEKAVSSAADTVAGWPVINQVEADRVLLAEAVAAQSEADDLRRFKDSVDGFDNGQLPEDSLCPIHGYESHRLRCDAAAQLDHLNAAFRAQFGKDLGITDTYRSLEDQIELKKRKPVLAGKPGTSNHGWGRAIDVSANVHWNYVTPEHLWMIENAPKFGWHNPSWAAEGGQKEEAWHWEFNGKYAPIDDDDSGDKERAVIEAKAEDIDKTDPREEKSDDASD